MALSKEIYGAVGTPRIYVDYVQYAKALGLIDKFTLENGIGGGDEDPSLAWDFNPTNMISYPLYNQVKWASFRIYLKYWEDDSNIQFRKLLSTSNYNMILGLDATGTTSGNQYSYAKFSYYESVETGWVGQPPPTKQIIVGQGGSGALHYADTLGYAIQEYPDGWDNDFSPIIGERGLGYERIEYNFANKTDDDAGDDNFQIGDILKIGTLSLGRYFDFPVNPDLNVSINFDYSGIKSAKNISGDEMTYINYHQSPNWGNLAPWTNIDLTPYQEQGIDPQQALLDQDYRAVRRGGRRTFKLNFSYIDKEDMFPKNFEGNLSGNYNYAAEELGDNLVVNGTMANFGAGYEGQELVDGVWTSSANVAQSWRSTYDTNVTVSKVTGNGFTGNAQRLEITANDQTFHFHQNNVFQLQGDTQYKVTFKYRSNSGHTSDTDVYLGYANFSSNDRLILPTTNGTAVSVTHYITPHEGGHDNGLSMPTYLSFYAGGRDTGTYLEVSDIEVREVIAPVGGWFDSNEGTHTDNIMGNFLNFTLGGQIPFIFQPDNTKQDFAICKLDKASSTIKQVAHGVYSVSMVFVETW